MRMIDPPSGWQYGFPKPLPNDVKDVNKWLVENGYPKKLIDDLGEYFYCRYWDKPDEDIKSTKIKTMKKTAMQKYFDYLRSRYGDKGVPPNFEYWLEIEKQQITDAFNGEPNCEGDGDRYYTENYTQNYTENI